MADSPRPPAPRLPLPEPTDPALEYPTAVFEYGKGSGNFQHYRHTGWFRKGSTQHTEEDLVRAVALVFDCDLKDWLIGKKKMDRGEASQAVMSAPATQINAWLAEQKVDVMAAWAGVMPTVRPTATVISGAGRHLYGWFLDDEGYGEERAQAKNVNKSLARMMNEHVGFQLVDLNATNTGVRVLRPVGTYNTKNLDRRLPVVLEEMTDPPIRLSLHAAAELVDEPDDHPSPVTYQHPALAGLRAAADGTIANGPLAERLSGQGLVADLREMISLDPVFMWAQREPHEVDYRVRRALAQNLIQRAANYLGDETLSGESERVARQLFHEIATARPTLGEPSNKRFDHAEMETRFDQAITSLARMDAAITYRWLADELGEEWAVKVLPAMYRGDPEVMASNAAAQQGHRVNERGKAQRRREAGRLHRVRSTEEYQLGTLEGSFSIQGPEWSGTVREWANATARLDSPTPLPGALRVPFEKNADGDRYMPVACPFGRKGEGHLATIRTWRDKIVLQCEVPEHDHTKAGRTIYHVVLAEELKRDPLTDGLIQRTKSGSISPSYHNIEIVLGNDPRFRRLVWYDEFTKNLMVATQDRSRALVDSDVTEICTRIGHLYGFSPPHDNTWKVLEMLGQRPGTAFNPVIDALDLMVWDGQARCEHFLSKALGVEDTPLVRSCSRRWLIALAARILYPGVKVDNILALIGDQGCGKSTAFDILAPCGLFSDTTIDLKNKDAYQQIHAVVIYEFSEMRGLSRSDETVKSFLSSRVDRFRPPYKRTVEVHPRHTVFVATSNNKEILTDPTGSRRFWPFECAGTPDKHRWLRTHRDQILAEAVIYAKRWAERTSYGIPGHDPALCPEYQWWLLPDEEKALHEASVEFKSADAWEGHVAGYLDYEQKAEKKLGGFTIMDVWIDGIGGKPEQCTEAAERRIGRILKANGYQSQRRRLGGKQIRFYFRPGVPINREPVRQDELRDPAEKQPDRGAGQSTP